MTTINKRIGTTENDQLLGTTGRDFLWGGDGNDKLDGGADRDVLYGGPGNDELKGGTGDDVLDGGDDSDRLYGGAGNDVLVGGTGFDKLYGGAGDDVLVLADAGHAWGGSGADVLIGVGSSNWRILQYGGSGAGVTVNLATGRGQGGDAQGDTISGFTGIVGSKHSDTLTGDEGDNYFRGRDGADVIDGGGGIDTVSFNLPHGDVKGVTVDLSGPKDDDEFITARGGVAEGERLKNIENLQGSQGDDKLTGDEKVNQLLGLGGDDVLEGRGGADILVGYRDTASYEHSPGGDDGSGVTVNLGVLNEDGWVVGTGGDAQDDKLKWIGSLRGSAHNDTLTGDSGDNVLEGGAGAWDKLDGGAGKDTASYEHSAGGVTVDLTRTGAQAGTAATNYDAAGDTLTRIENLRGSAYADTLTGDRTANVLDGGAGADTLTGGRGDDTLTGGAGADKLDGGPGSDTASYLHSSRGVVVNLGGPQDEDDYVTGHSGGDAGGDRLKNIENLEGSRLHGDTLTGNNEANRLEGRGGDDYLYGKGGADELDGGAGEDTLEGGAGEDTLVGSLDSDLLKGGSENDELEGGADFDVLIGGAGADTLTGGTDADWFVFDSESVVASDGDLAAETDVVEDFSGLGEDGVKQADEDGDKLHLSALTEGLEVKPTLTFLTTQGAGFTGRAGQVRYEQEDEAGTENDVTHVQMDLDGVADAEGNYAAEFQVTLEGLHTLTAADLILA